LHHYLFSAFGNSLAGKIAIAQQRVKDLQEELGGKLLPLKVKLLEFVNDLSAGFIKLATDIRTAISLGIGLGEAGDLRRTIELNKQFREQQSNAELEPFKGASRADITTERIQRQAELDKLNAITSQNNKSIRAGRGGFIPRDRVDYYYQRIGVLEALIPKLKELTKDADKVLGISQDDKPDKNEKDNTADEIKRLTEELNQLEKQFDLKKMTAFSQKITEINDKFDKIVKRAKELNQGNLVDRANAERQRQIEDATNALIESGVKKIPGLADTTPAAFSSPFSKGIEKLIEGKKPGNITSTQKPKTGSDATIGDYVEYAKNVVSIYASINASINSLQQQELDGIRASNDKKKESYQKLLDSNLISRKEYDKKVLLLDKQLDDRERKIRIDQFKRNKLESLSNAAINVAEAATKAFTKGPIVGQILAGVVAALGAVQIGIIAAQQPPKFGKGGRLKGPSHSQGGMPVIDPRTGRKQAELEGEEVILSRNTVENNPELVGELLHSSLNRNGARIGSIYGNRGRLPSINFGNASKSISRVNHYANGGVFQQSTTDTSNIEQTLDNMNMVIKELANRLNQGIVAVASVQQFNEQQQRLADLKSDVTMK